MKKRILAAILAAMMCLPVMAEEETYETTEIVEEIQDNEESLVVVEEDEQLGDEAEAAEEISEVEEAEEDVAEEVVEENDESEAIEQSEVIENDEAAEETEEVSEEKAEEIIISAEIEVTIGSEETEETETSEENNEEKITEETVEEIEETEEVEEAEEQTEAEEISEAEEEPEPILIMAETPMLLTATANEQTSTDSPSDDDDHGVFTVIGNSIQNHVKYSELGNITLVGTFHYKGDDVDADVTAGGKKYKGLVWHYFGHSFYKEWTINGSKQEFDDGAKIYSTGTKITASFNLGSYKNYFHSGMNTVKCHWDCGAGMHQASYTWYIYLPNVYLESIYLSSGQTFTKTEMKNSNAGFEARYWGIDESTLSLNSDTFIRTWTLNGTQISSSELTYKTGHQITSICYLKNIADKCKTGVNTLTLTMTDKKRGDTASYTWTFTVPDIAVSVSAPESVEGYLGEYVTIPITYTVSADEAQAWYYYMYIDGVVKFSNDPQYEGSNSGVRYGDWTATNEWKVLCDTTGTKTVNIKIELKAI